MEVLICDDHPIVASAIAAMIENVFHASVHMANSYQHAISIVSEHRDISLCLLDLHIPGEDARAGINALQGSLPEARFVLFSGSALEADLMLALDLQTHGFLPKSSNPQVIEAALRLVLAGGTYLPSGIGDIALRNARRFDGTELFVPCPASPETVTPHSFETGYSALTVRQVVILQQVSMGRSNKEIARELEISPATVKVHVSTIIALLGAANRVEAAARARGLGLIE